MMLAYRCIDLHLEITGICTFFILVNTLKNNIELLEGKKEEKVDHWIISRLLNFFI